MTQTTTLAELAGTSLNAIRILERYGLDYCCGGKQALENACLKNGLAADQVLREIAAASLRPEASQDWRNAPLQDLARYILRTHHEYLKLNLPTLHSRLRKVIEVHVSNDPDSLPRMEAAYSGLRDELEIHLHKEEVIQALYAGLQNLESDLHMHIHLENNILFPRAIALESRAK